MPLIQRYENLMPTTAEVTVIPRCYRPLALPLSPILIKKSGTVFGFCIVPDGNSLMHNPIGFP